MFVNFDRGRGETKKAALTAALKSKRSQQWGVGYCSE
jgi:hypothetical protein